VRSKAMGKSTVLLLTLPLAILAQLDIREKSDYITQKHDDSELTKEIYTSMHELNEFFEKEKLYVNDLMVIQEKKLVFQVRTIICFFL